MGYLLGFSVLLYPTVSNYLQEKNATTIVSSYEQILQDIQPEEERQILEQAAAYNASLTALNAIEDPFSNGTQTEDEAYLNALESGWKRDDGVFEDSKDPRDSSDLSWNRRAGLAKWSWTCRKYVPSGWRRFYAQCPDRAQGAAFGGAVYRFGSAGGGAMSSLSKSCMKHWHMK